MHAGKSPSTFFELFPAASFTCASVASLIFSCVAVCIRLLVVFPSSLRLCPVSRLLTVVAMSFLTAIFPFDLRLQIQCLDI